MAQSQDPNSELAGEAKEVAKPVEQPVEQEPKKAYYNPGEVMKKKGCIGCGGMVLAVPILLAVLGLVVAL
jgi:hypothetical protein